MLSPGRLSPLNFSSTAVSSSSSPSLSSPSPSSSSPSLSSLNSSSSPHSSTITVKVKTRNKSTLLSSSFPPRSSSSASSPRSRFRSPPLSLSPLTSLYSSTTLPCLLLFLVLISAAGASPVARSGSPRFPSADRDSSRGTREYPRVNQNSDRGISSFPIADRFSGRDISSYPTADRDSLDKVNATLWETNGTVYQNDMPQAERGDLPQGDQPPRDMNMNPFPNSWSRQPQQRIYYLRAQNDQYLQVYNNTITGTKATRPVFGMVHFLSHEMHLLMRSYHSKQFLCMNKESELYVAERQNSECYLNESSLHLNGSLMKTYEFIAYRGDTGKRYLGIDCEPLLGKDTNTNQESSRFIAEDVDESIAKKASEEIHKGGGEDKVGEKCQSRKKEERANEKEKRRKLRWRWCWNLNRMVNKRKQYYDRCLEKHKKQCNRSGGSDQKGCVCEILSKMLSTYEAKRAKRKCLAEKLTRWVQNKGKTPNNTAIVEAARELLPMYTGIALRIRRLKKAKMKKQREEVKKSQGRADLQSQIQTHHQTSVQPPPRRPSSPTHPHRHRKHQSKTSSHHRRHRGRRRRQKCTKKAVKLNSILKQFGHELFNETDNPKQSVKTLSATPSGTGVGEPKNFSEAVRKLKEEYETREKKQRRRCRRRRKKRRPAKSRPSSQVSSSKNDDRDSSKFRSEAPG